jgi:hypothetical protein
VADPKEVTFSEERGMGSVFGCEVLKEFFIALFASLLGQERLFRDRARNDGK